ncbi:MAG: phosphoribosylformylglycinamidine synthase subunit PurL [Candidatus Melainabacteria bacterium]
MVATLSQPQTTTTFPSANADVLQQTLRQLNIRESEYALINKLLQRTPNMTELAMFSVLWSEHCCYKNSRHLLRKLPNQSPRVVAGPGENAGIVDVGDGIQIAFKIESHNHPTAVEPFQGAATGVGGILRDIFTMNARPIANLNSLRFGPLSAGPGAARNHYLFTHAVAGIGHYGNCVGVPTIAGECFFDDSYTGNPLVNAMSIGILYNNNITSSKAVGAGNPVLYVGSATGKDGMGGAAFASRELHEGSQDDRPAVQVGDPFSEKLLIEACLEAFATGCVVAAQDMGAAGLTSSSCEMAAKGNLGMRIDLDLVPAREADMQPHEYLLSESQERMLFVLEKGNEQPVLDVFAKWRVPAVVVGEVTGLDADGEPHITFTHRGQTVVDLPVRSLTDWAPDYDPGWENGVAPGYQPPTAESHPFQLPADLTADAVETALERMMARENIAQPRGVFTQYDSQVQNNTLLYSEQLASGVIRLRNEDNTTSGKAIAATTDCNARHVYLNPRRGTKGAVAEAVRNLACVGAEPLAVTDNLNFGNPEKPEIYYQLYQSVEGMREACLSFEIPVISGNVSLYNEHSGSPILPAPVIGMVGLIENDRQICSPRFKAPGHTVALVGRFAPSLAGSEYAAMTGCPLTGEPPSVDLKAERAMATLIRRWVASGALASVQDVSMGGLLSTLCECAFGEELGVTANLSALCRITGRLDACCFGETHGSYLISFDAASEQTLKNDLEALGNPALQLTPLGQTTSDFKLRLTLDGQTRQTDLTPLLNAWSHTLDLAPDS